MIVKHKEQLKGTSRSVETNDWSTTRFLLREDGVGFTVTDVMIYAGSDAIYRYRHHVEACYCIEGEATLEDLESGEVHQIRAGSLWAVPNHERFRFIAHKPTRLISVFSPALVGPEVNDAEGSFPKL